MHSSDEWTNKLTIKCFVLYCTLLLTLINAWAGEFIQFPVMWNLTDENNCNISSNNYVTNKGFEKMLLKFIVKLTGNWRISNWISYCPIFTLFIINWSILRRTEEACCGSFDLASARRCYACAFPACPSLCWISVIRSHMVFSFGFLYIRLISLN